MIINYVDAADAGIADAERDSIENSIGTIASTPYGAAPFIRSMGIKNYPPDNDSALARNRYAAEVISQCGIWEDRAKLEKITFDKDSTVRMEIEYGKS